MTRRAAGRQPAAARGVPRAPALAVGHGASAAPTSAAAFTEPAAAADMGAEAGCAMVPRSASPLAGSPSAKGEADLGVELPAKWLKKPRSAGRHGPRQVTPPEEGSWWE